MTKYYSTNHSSSRTTSPPLLSPLFSLPSSSLPFVLPPSLPTSSLLPPVAAAPPRSIERRGRDGRRGAQQHTSPPTRPRHLTLPVPDRATFPDNHACASLPRTPRPRRVRPAGTDGGGFFNTFIEGHDTSGRHGKRCVTGGVESDGETPPVLFRARTGRRRRRRRRRRWCKGCL